MKIARIIRAAAVAQAAAVVAMTLSLPQAAAAQAPPGIAEGWMGEFDHASRQLLRLAEATPAEKFAWRPAPNVRSVAEVYMHIALGNHYLLSTTGVPLPEVFKKLGKQPEKSISEKAEVVSFLRESLDAVRSAYKTADRQKTVQLFKKDVTVDGVFLRILVHNHEHMGQSIAYARSAGVVPPWSDGQ